MLDISLTENALQTPTMSSTKMASVENLHELVKTHSFWQIAIEITIEQN
jgi:hypothetical protein